MAVSVLKLSPVAGDDGSRLQCAAESSALPNRTVSHHVLLRVLCQFNFFFFLTVYFLVAFGIKLLFS